MRYTHKIGGDGIMSQNYTIVNFEEGNPLRCTMRRLGVVEPHIHEFFELDMVLSGTCQVSIGAERFRFSSM